MVTFMYLFMSHTLQSRHNGEKDLRKSQFFAMPVAQDTGEQINLRHYRLIIPHQESDHYKVWRLVCLIIRLVMRTKLHGLSNLN